MEWGEKTGEAKAHSLIFKLWVIPWTATFKIGGLGHGLYEKLLVSRCSPEKGCTGPGERSPMDSRRDSRAPRVSAGTQRQQSAEEGRSRLAIQVLQRITRTVACHSAGQTLHLPTSGRETRFGTPPSAPHLWDPGQQRRGHMRRKRAPLPTGHRETGGLTQSPGGGM